MFRKKACVQRKLRVEKLISYKLLFSFLYIIVLLYHNIFLYIFKKNQTIMNYMESGRRQFDISI